MGSFGDRLRREREMRGISLDEIATATKISARNLRALEEEKFNQLPGGIFNKGFVRAYAKFLGIDEEQIVAEYVTASEETESSREFKFKEFSKPEIKQDDEQEISLEPKSQWGTIAVIVLIAVLIYAGYSTYQRKKLERAQQQSQSQAVAPPVSKPAPPPVTPVASTTPTPDTTTPSGTDQKTASTTDTTPKTETPKPGATKPAAQKSATDVPTATKPPADTAKSSAAPSPIDLKVKVNKQSWVSIKADGKLLLSENLAAGTERTFKAADKIEVVLGNAGGVELSYNGKPVENLGGGQDVRKMTFTPSGYE